MGGTPWVGRHVFDLFRAADWRQPLVALLGEERYAATGDLIELASPMVADGDWVVGTGRGKFDCWTCVVGVAIHRDDGRLLVVVSKDGNVGMWGDPQGPVPLLLRELLGSPPA